MNIRFLALAIVAAAFSLSLSASAPTAPRVDDLPHQLDLAGLNADNNATRLVDSYRMLVAQLEGQLLDHRSTDSQRVYAAYLLGAIGARSAATSLIRYIDLEAPWQDPRDRIGRWSRYPATDALRKLGMYAVALITPELSRDQTPLRRTLMCQVIKGVLGPKLGRIWLEDAAAAQKDPASRANLDLAVREFIFTAGPEQTPAQ